MNTPQAFSTPSATSWRPNVVTSSELEKRVEPVYQTLRLPPGQLEALTGIRRAALVGRRASSSSHGAVAAGGKAAGAAGVRPRIWSVVIYAGVCREQFEPATACAVAAASAVERDVPPVYDLSNACLGVLNGIVDIANRIELGQIRAGPRGVVRVGARNQRQHDRLDA